MPESRADNSIWLSFFKNHKRNEPLPKKQLAASEHFDALQHINAEAAYESRIGAIRETIDRLEADLAAMIRDVQRN